MRRQSIEGRGNSQHARASNEDPVQAKCDTEEFVAETSKEFATNIVDTIDIRVIQLKGTDNIAGPTRHDSDDQNDDDTGYQAQAVKYSWNGEDTKTNLRLQHKHSCTFPPNLLELTTCSEPINGHNLRHDSSDHLH